MVYPENRVDHFDNLATRFHSIRLSSYNEPRNVKVLFTALVTVIQYQIFKIHRIFKCNKIRKLKPRKLSERLCFINLSAG